MQLNKNKTFDHQTIEGLDKITNLVSFEENSEVDEDKSNKLTAVAQTPDNSSILNKRSLSEIDGMDVDENISHKKIKTYSQGHQTISEEIVSEDLKKMVLFQKNSIQMHQYSFGEESKAESSFCYKSRTELMSS